MEGRMHDRHIVQPRFCRAMLAVILCLLPALTGGFSPSVGSSAKQRLDHVPRDQQQMLPPNIAAASDFQKSYKVRPSVSDDPFYLAPDNSTNALAGSVLKVERETNTSLYTIPPALSLSRFMYQSKTVNGTLVPVSAFILWPYAAQEFRDIKGIPFVAWAHGTSGISPECAPSNIKFLWYQFQGLFELAMQGYAIVATDYAGLGVGKDAQGKTIIHEYLTFQAQANDIYYSAIAARTAFPSLSQQFVAMGHSEGGGAAWSFAEKLAKEPLQGYLGTIALSPFARFLDLPADEPILPGLFLLLVSNLQANYGPFVPEDILTPKGIQGLQYVAQTNACTTALLQIVGPDLLKPGWQNNTSIQKFDKAVSNGGKPIGGPLLIVQGGADPVISAPSVEAGIRNTLQKVPNSQIEYRLLPNVTHVPTMYAGFQFYYKWINERFAGVPAPESYYAATATLARPPSSLQTEANWFIQEITEPYQMT